jgi:UvrD-like helicase C-terminal domain/AAA domain
MRVADLTRNKTSPSSTHGNRLILTSEQEAVVEAFLARRTTRVIAYAGAAKSSTLVEAAKADGGTRSGIYAAFNKQIANDAAKKFPKWVKCSTWHSLAYSQTPPALKKKLNFPRLPGFQLAMRYGIRDTSLRNVFGQEHSQSASEIGNYVANTVTQFCRSSFEHLDERSLMLPDTIDDTSKKQLSVEILRHASKLWHEILDPNSDVPLSHDAYLKRWAMVKPSLACDYLLFDEAQDADGVMLGIIRAQQAQVCAVGDPYQQIYDWRGAINALDYFKGDELALTRSFRFGEDLAEAAWQILQPLGAKLPIRGLEGRETQVRWQATEDKNEYDALLCRTNASCLVGLFEVIAEKKKVCLIADKKELQGFLDAADMLHAGFRPDHQALSNFSKWDQLVEYSESRAGSDYAAFVKIVNTQGVSGVRRALESTVEAHEADVIVSTAHKAKGLEWNRVRLASDFSTGTTRNGQFRIDPAECRLLYVAMTRARLECDVSGAASAIRQLAGNDDAH